MKQGFQNLQSLLVGCMAHNDFEYEDDDCLEEMLDEGEEVLNEGDFFSEMTKNLESIII